MAVFKVDIVFALTAGRSGKAHDVLTAKLGTVSISW